jgi:uncharacterized membrane protein
MHACLGTLVEEALAYGRAAEARNAICGADLALKLVVIRELVVCRGIESAKVISKTWG